MCKDPFKLLLELAENPSAQRENQTLLFFFFWINKNLFPKGQSPTKNTHEVKKDPKKMKKRTAPPLKQRKRGISSKQKYT